jgi:hypothetical protein
MFWSLILVPACCFALVPCLVPVRELSVTDRQARISTSTSLPSTGLTTGACPGYVKDHIRALACGGPDSVENLQWQTTAEAKAKDKRERKSCGR